jgi:two-component sensor histidine kinase
VVDDVASPWIEKDRLAALKSYHLLDTQPEAVFDDLVRLAARACAAPIGWIGFVDEGRLWFKAEVGLGRREMTLEQFTCARAILQPGLTAIRDLAADPRFHSHPLVIGEPHVRFYAGVSLATPDGLPIGTFGVLDHRPRDLSEDQAFTLTVLAQQVMAQLDLRRSVADRDVALAASQRVERRHALLVRELHHRVRNTLAVVQSLLGTTARRAGSVEEFYFAFSARIAALAKTQALLTDDYWQTASLRELASTQVQPFGNGAQPRITLTGPALDLSADLAVPLGMALHELAANAAKFGALSVPQGCVDLTWDVREVKGKRTVRLVWIEHEGPLVDPPRHEGFGSTLLRKVLPMQIHAKVDLQFARDGLRCGIEAPLIERRLVPVY